MRNLQEQVKKAFCYQKLIWTFTVWINCSSHLKYFANSWPSALNFNSFSRSVEQFFLTVGQNNFGNKIPKFLMYIQQFHNILKKKRQMTIDIHIDYCHLTRFLRNKQNKFCHIVISRDFSHQYHSKKWTRRNLYLVFFGWGLHKWSLEMYQLHSKNLTDQAVLVLVLS